jgi:hypothetical protein
MPNPVGSKNSIGASRRQTRASCAGVNATIDPVAARDGMFARRLRRRVHVARLPRAAWLETIGPVLHGNGVCDTVVRLS